MYQHDECSINDKVMTSSLGVVIGSSRTCLIQSQFVDVLLVYCFDLCQHDQLTYVPKITIELVASPPCVVNKATH